jgi:hypothetical protein
MFVGTGFEVLTVVRIHIAVWVRTPCMVMRILDEHNGSVFTGSQKMEAVCSDRNLGTHRSSSSSLLHSINPLAGLKKLQDVEIVQYK